MKHRLNAAWNRRAFRAQWRRRAQQDAEAWRLLDEALRDEKPAGAPPGTEGAADRMVSG